MRPSIQHGNKRCIAFVMLLVWMFTLGAGLANACLLDGLQSGQTPRDRDGRIVSTAVTPATMAAVVDDLHTPAHHDDDHARSHQLHCQPLQAVGRTLVTRLSAEKSLDQATIVASVARWANPMHSTDRRPVARQRSGPVTADLPLFIRFRRLIP